MIRHKNSTLLILMLILTTSVACRLTTRINNQQQNSINDTDNAEGTTRDNSNTVGINPAPNNNTNTETAGDDFENLLDGLIHENDSADDLDDFSDFDD